MTSPTLAASRPVHRSTIVLAALALLCAVLVAAALLWPNRAADTVGLIPPACATIDPVRFPCPAGNDVVVVAR